MRFTCWLSVVQLAFANGSSPANIAGVVGEDLVHWMIVPEKERCIWTQPQKSCRYAAKMASPNRNLPID
jgi:hypothetical protein